MPELPEVASFEKYLKKHAEGKKILSAKTFDAYLLKNISKTKLEKLLKGNKITDTHRHGKNLFCQLEKNGTLYFHFGMTGYFEDREEEQFKYPQLILELENGHYFAFICKRKLGKIMVIDDIDEFLKENKIGPDALSISKKAFTESVKKRRGNIKSLLMNQSFMAGVGNEFSDEILFKAKIHPESIPKNIPEERVEAIFDAMNKVLKESVKANADRDKLEHYFFLENRKSGMPCPGGKGKAVKRSIGGRSSFFCPEVQKQY